MQQFPFFDKDLKNIGALLDFTLVKKPEVANEDKHEEVHAHAHEAHEKATAKSKPELFRTQIEQT